MTFFQDMIQMSFLFRRELVTKYLRTIRTNLCRFENKIQHISLIWVPRLDLFFFELNFRGCFWVKHHHLFYYKLAVILNWIRWTKLINQSFVNCIFQMYWWIIWLSRIFSFSFLPDFTILHLKTIFIWFLFSPF